MALKGKLGVIPILFILLFCNPHLRKYFLQWILEKIEGREKRESEWVDG